MPQASVGQKSRSFQLMISEKKPSALSRSFWASVKPESSIRVRPMTPPAHFGNDLAPRRLGQQTHFFQLVLEIGLTEVELNDHRAFAGSGSFNHEGFRNA